MNESALPPEQWRPLFDNIGVEFGYRPLATRIGMNHTKVRRLLLGGGTTHDTVEKIADAFRVSPEKVYELRGESAITRRPFTLPDEAWRLTDTERSVIRQMVRALLDARELGNEDQGTQDTTSNPPNHGSAGVDGTSNTRAGDAGADNVTPLIQPDQVDTPDWMKRGAASEKVKETSDPNPDD